MKISKRLKDRIALKKQQKNASGNTTKRIGFSLVQAAFFAFEILRGKGRFRPRIVVGDWPYSEQRTKYLILGTMLVDEEQILVENWGKIYKLGACPQKEFFRKLDCGEDVQADPYYNETKEQLDYTAFEAWLRVKTELWESFNQEPGDFTPIAIRHSIRQFVVQDGAHRLSLRSLRGYNSHRLGIGLVVYNQKR